MPTNWTEEDVQKLIGQEETYRLEFKSGKFLSDKQKVANDLSREISAFANAEGGTIFLGIAEEKKGKSNVAAFIDGINEADWPSFILHQVIESNVRPLLLGLRIHRIPVADGKVVYAIDVPPGRTAYQASDFCYYGRSGSRAMPLPDQEVRLRMERGRRPHAVIESKVALKRRAEDVEMARLTVYIDQVDQLIKIAPAAAEAEVEIPAMAVGELETDAQTTKESLPQRILRKLAENDPQTVEDFGWVLERPNYDEYEVSLILINEGELTLRDFEVKAILTCSPGFVVTESSIQSENGLLMAPEPDERIQVEKSFQFSRLVSQARIEPRLFPGASVQLGTFAMLHPKAARGFTGNFKLKWTVYLDDVRPVIGEAELETSGDWHVEQEAEIR